MYVHVLIAAAGGLSHVLISAVEYRVEPREMKARTELECIRIIWDTLNYPFPLINYAIECRLKELGTYSLIDAFLIWKKGITSFSDIQTLWHCKF